MWRRVEALKRQEQQQQRVPVKIEQREEEEERPKHTAKRVREEREEDVTLSVAPPPPPPPKPPRVRPNKRFADVKAAVATASEMVAEYQKDVIEQTNNRKKRAREKQPTAVVVAHQPQQQEEGARSNVSSSSSSLPQVKTSRLRAADGGGDDNSEGGGGGGVLPLDDLRARMDSREMFQAYFARAKRSQDDIVSRIPKLEDLIPLMQRVEEGQTASAAAAGGGDVQQASWDRSFTAHAIERGLELPILEVITPAYVADFLREPDPLKSWERVCLPPKEFKACESVEMGGPPLREFLLPSQTKSLLPTQSRSLTQMPYFSNSTTVVLPTLRRSCFLCSQRLIFKHWAKQKSACMSAPGSADNRLIHEYIMAVNCPEGYDMRLILPGFTEWIGLAGPVIQHNRLHYALSRFENNRCGWVQKPEMLFQHGAMRLQ
jgi:hypothetical protein